MDYIDSYPENKSEVIFLHKTCCSKQNCSVLKCSENSLASFLTEKSVKMSGRFISHKKCLPTVENLQSALKSLLLVNFSGQLNTTEPTAHFPSSSMKEGKRKRRIKARKLGCQDKTSKQTKV